MLESGARLPRSAMVFTVTVLTVMLLSTPYVAPLSTAQDTKSGDAPVAEIQNSSPEAQEVSSDPVQLPNDPNAVLPTAEPESETVPTPTISAPATEEGNPLQVPSSTEPSPDTVTPTPAAEQSTAPADPDEQSSSPSTPEATNPATDSSLPETTPAADPPTPPSTPGSTVPGSEPTSTTTPAVDQPSIPDAQATFIATPSATISPSPTSAPTRVVSWKQAAPVVCGLADDVTADLGYQESIRYRCESIVVASSDAEMPVNLDIEWVLEVGFPDGYMLELPGDSPGVVTHQESVGVGSTRYFVSQPWIQADSEQRLSFDLVISRTTCGTGVFDLTVSSAPIITSSDSAVEIVGNGAAATTFGTSTTFVPNQQSPKVQMSAVEFGSLQWNRTSYGSAHATSVITITNAAPCATNQVHLVSLLVSSSDPGLVPTISSVESGSDGIELVKDSRVVGLIPAGFSGTATLTVELELAPSNDMASGHYSFGFEVSVIPAP